MELTYSPAALPGSCYFCGNGSREFYIDTGVSVEFHGAMYICNVCASEIAKLLKFIPHDEYKALRADNEELSEMAYTLRKQLDAFQGAFDAFVSAGYNINSELGITRSGGAVLEDVSESDEAVSDGEGELGEGTGASTESSDDKDVGELRSDDAEHESDTGVFGFLGTGKGSK